MIRKIAILFLFSFISYTGLVAQEVYEHQFLVQPGDQMPDFRVQLTDGTWFQLSDQKAKVIMLQFTASWCGVCRKEMPFIEKDIWQKLNNDDFVLIGLDYKEEPEKVNAFAKDMNISYPLAYDTEGQVFHSIAAIGAGVTRNVIIDREGKIIFLSRLFNLEEFEKMTEVIFNEIEKKD